MFYAFCRLMDDIADEEGRAPAEKRRELEAWKEEIASLYGGSKELSPLAAEMADVVARRKIPQEYIQAIIDGVMRDTSGEPFETFEDIRKYCYGVASAGGACDNIHIRIQKRAHKTLRRIPRIRAAIHKHSARRRVRHAHPEQVLHSAQRARIFRGVGGRPRRAVAPIRAAKSSSA